LYTFVRLYLFNLFHLIVVIHDLQNTLQILENTIKWNRKTQSNDWLLVQKQTQIILHN